MEKNTLRALIVILIVILGIYLWYSFIKFENCKDLECFNKNLARCTRARYLNKDSWTYLYNIEGVKNNECVVNVKLIFAGLEQKFETLINQDMECSIPLKKIDLPEEDLDYCTGKLKENMQYLVIKDLYKHAAQNLGK
jgi:hypothetical protein